jgi:iron complex transport system ATP-binding protein
VVLARALAQETPVLLLDEPTAHQDVGQQAMTLALVQREVTRSRKAVLAVVHDLTLAGQCDRVIVLSEGKVIADGPPKEVIRPELLSEVYGLDAHILSHPDTGDPVVAPSFRQA